MLKNLCTKNKRLIKHLTTLYNAPHRLSVSELSAQSKCSQKTVYSDIDYLNYIYEGLIHIVIDKPHLEMDKIGSGTLNRIIKDIIRNDINFQVILSFYTDALETVEHYAVKHDISVQSVHNIRHEANKFLKQYKAQIVRKENLYYIKSEDEILLQSLFAHFIHFNASPDSEDFKMFLEYFRITHLNKVSLQINTHLDKTLLERDLNAFIKSSYIRVKGFKNARSYQEISKEVFIVLEAFPKLTENTAPFAFDFTNRTFTKLKLTDENKLNQHRKDKFSDLVHYAYIISYVLRDDSYTNQFRISEFAKHYKIQNPVYYHYVETTILKQNLPAEMDKKNLIHTLLYFIFIYFNDAIPKELVNILVSSDLSLEHAHSLASQIERHFPMHQCFITTNASSFNEVKATYPNIDFRFVVSTAKVHKSIKLPVVYVSDFISSTDYERIFEKLYNKKDIK